MDLGIDMSLTAAPAGETRGAEEGDQRHAIYRVYLTVHDYALTTPDAPPTGHGQGTTNLELLSWIRSKFFLSYLLAYTVIYTVLLLPQFLIEPFNSARAVPRSLFLLLPSMLVLASFSALMSFAAVRRYHRTAGTLVASNSKLNYDVLYPKQLTRRLLWINAFPFTYMTFAVVPAITRVQHLLLNRIQLQSPTLTQGGASVDTRLNRFAFLYQVVHQALAANNLDARVALPILRALVARRLRELELRGQLIAVLLSSLGIIVSLLATLSKEPILTALSRGNRIEGLMAATVVTIVLGLAVYLVSQLQTTGGQGRDLRAALDVIDVVVPPVQQEPSN